MNATPTTVALNTASIAADAAANADELGSILAKIAVLTARADRTTVAYSKLVKDLKVAPEVIAKYATLSAVFSVKISLK